MTGNWIVEATKHGIYSLSSTNHKLNLPEPPVPRLLYTNDPPTDAQIVLIKAAIAEAISEAARFRRKLLERDTHRNVIKGLTTVIQARIDTADTFIQMHQGMLSPVRRMPPELFQEIFFFANGDPYYDDPSRDSNIVMSWRLSQVCRTWRKISFSTSALWVHLPCIALDRLYSRTIYFLKLLTEVLERSRGAPINLHIFAPRLVEAHPVLDLLVGHSERWRVFKLVATSSRLPLLRGIRGRLPLLEILSIWIIRHDPPFLVDCDLFEIAPKLHYLDLNDCAMERLILPVSQLTTYKDRVGDSYDNGYRNVQLVVTEATFLERLIIMNLVRTITIPLITLPSLVQLQVSFAYWGHHGILENLTLPAIEDLTITDCHPRDPLISTLISMILRSDSTCPLKRLALIETTNVGGELTTLLQLTPRLEYLSLPMPSVDDLRNLIFNPSIGDNLVPFLEKCIFTGFNGGDFKHGVNFSQVFNAFAFSRCEDIPPMGCSSSPYRNRNFLQLSIECTPFQKPLAYYKTILHCDALSETSLYLVMLADRLMDGPKTYEGLTEISGSESSPARLNLPILKIEGILNEIEHIQISDIRDVYVRRFVLFSHYILLTEAPASILEFISHFAIFCNGFTIFRNS